jgi:hypothetical protein
LKLVTHLCEHEAFRLKLIDQKEIFDQIKQISVSTDNYTTYKTEIQTALCECLNNYSE